MSGDAAEEWARAPEQVRLAPFHFPGAGAAKDEAEPHAFDHPVHFVQQLGHLLNLIDDDRIALVGARQFPMLQFLPDDAGILKATTVFVRKQQVEPWLSGTVCSSPSGEGPAGSICAGCTGQDQWIAGA